MDNEAVIDCSSTVLQKIDDSSNEIVEIGCFKTAIEVVENDDVLNKNEWRRKIGDDTLRYIWLRN